MRNADTLKRKKQNHKNKSFFLPKPLIWLKLWALAGIKELQAQLWWAWLLNNMVINTTINQSPWQDLQFRRKSAKIRVADSLIVAAWRDTGLRLNDASHTRDAQCWEEIKCHFIYTAQFFKNNSHTSWRAVARCGQQRRAGVWNSGLSRSKHSQHSQHTGLRSAAQRRRWPAGLAQYQRCSVCVINTVCSGTHNSVFHYLAREAVKVIGNWNWQFGPKSFIWRILVEQKKKKSARTIDRDKKVDICFIFCNSKF